MDLFIRGSFAPVIPTPNFLTTPYHAFYCGAAASAVYRADITNIHETVGCLYLWFETREMSYTHRIKRGGRFRSKYPKGSISIIRPVPVTICGRRL